MRRSLAIFITGLLLLATLVGCNTQDDPSVSPPASEPETAEETPPVAADDAVTDTAKILADLTRTAENSLDVIADILSVADEVGYPDPSLDEYEMLLYRIGDLDFPVFTQDFDTLNHERVLEFVEEYKEGRDCEITIFEIYNFAFYSYTVTVKNGKMYETMGYINYDDLEPGIDLTQEVDRLEYTESGHLIWHIAGEDDSGSQWQGLRVKPQGEHYLDLTRAYVNPIWMTQDLIDNDWSQGNYDSVNWDYVFERLIYAETGQLLYTWYEEKYAHIDAEDGLPEAFPVPAGDVEPVLQKYFPVTADELHRIEEYNAQENAYYFRGFLGGGYAPSPELVAVEENEDGSITMTVNAVALRWGETSAFQCQLTVLPDENGGFQYLSNEFLGYSGN